MQRHSLFRRQRSMLAILVLLLSACAPIKTPPTAAADIALPSPISQAALTPTPSLEPTLNAITPTGGSLSSNATCSKAEVEQCEKDVLTLANEHVADSKKAEGMESITDETTILSFNNRAVTRMESLQAIQAPSCLQEAHEKLIVSFDLLIKTWDLIKKEDYSTATTTLRNSYETFSNGLAKIEILKLGW